MAKICVTCALILLSVSLFLIVAVNGGIPSFLLGVYWALVSVYWGCNLWSQRRR